MVVFDFCGIQCITRENNEIQLMTLDMTHTRERILISYMNHSRLQPVVCVD